nr:hypothetical protein [Tanacetum cinerariifolium]
MMIRKGFKEEEFRLNLDLLTERKKLASIREARSRLRRNSSSLKPFLIIMVLDYESWKIRIERYIRGKPLGKLIWRSIQNGPTLHPQITVTEGQGVAAVQVTRDKTDEEFIEIKNNRELADIQATDILSQGLPRHVFNILNQMRTGKEIWDNVELLMKAQSSSIVDPLAYLASTTHHLTPTQPTNPPPSTSLLTLPPQPAAQSSNDAMLATMNQIVNLLSGFQKQFPLTNNQLRTSSNSRSHATVHDGHIVTETVQRKAPGNVGNTDEGLHAATTFMANLSSTSGTNGATTSYVNEYQLDSEVQDVPTEVSSLSPGEISMITILDYLRKKLDGHLKVNQEQSIVNDSLRAELARCKLEIQILERNKVKHDLDTTIVRRNKWNVELEQENVLLKSNLS